MTPRYPGATWYPVGQDLGSNNGPNGVTTHGAITTGNGVAIGGWVDTSNACHGFVEHLGGAYQYKDFDQVAYGTLEGNYRGVITWETWDGLVVSTATYHDVNVGADQQPSGLWTPEQCERLADIAAFDENELNIPAVMMHNTRDRAHGVHRSGIDNPTTEMGIRLWVGPDRFSVDMQKPCPGDKRILQYLGTGIDGGAGSILARARVIAAAVRAGTCGYLPVGDVNLIAAYARTGNNPDGWLDMGAREDILAAVATDKTTVGAQVAAVAAQVKALEGRLFGPVDASGQSVGHSLRGEVQWSALNQTIPAAAAVTTNAAAVAAQTKVYSLCEDKNTGAIYAYAPGTWFHVQSPADVALGKTAGIFPESDIFVTDSATISKLRDLCIPSDMSLYVKPPVPPVPPVVL